MAAPTTKLTTDELRKEVARFLGYPTGYMGLNSSQQDDVDRCVRRGLRRFYAPPPIENEKASHQWTFLVPRATITTTAGDADYQLPEDFGGLVDPFTYAANTIRCPIRVVADEQLRTLASGAANTTGRPTHASCTPEVTAGDSPNATPDIPTRWQVFLWPTPDDAYVLTYRYYVVQDVVTTTLNPPGGGLHAETIIAACLSVAEELQNNSMTNRPMSIQKDLFAERLVASVSIDRRTGNPSVFGTNSDASDSRWPAMPEVSVTYDGTQY